MTPNRVRRLHLFLYGTLQPGAGTPMARWLSARIEAALPASAPGGLWGIASQDGWYPALVSGPAGERCRGTLARLVLSARELALLDRYEGREYRRAVFRVQSADGASHCAATYRWQAPLPRSAVAIPGGDFLAWLSSTNRRPYGSAQAATRTRGGALPTIDPGAYGCHRAAP